MARRKAEQAARKTTKVATRTRRSPYDIVQALKEERERLVQTLSERIAKLDTQIAEKEARYRERIEVDRMIASKSSEELAREEADLKARLAMTRKARKLSGGK